MPKPPKKIKDMTRTDMWHYGWAMKNAGVPYKKMMSVLHKWERKTGQKWFDEEI